MTFARHSVLMECTNRSAWEFRFGEREDSDFSHYAIPCASKS
jgi:hypothetical protein